MEATKCVSTNFLNNIESKLKFSNLLIYNIKFTEYVNIHSNENIIIWCSQKWFYLSKLLLTVEWCISRYIKNIDLDWWKDP